jgi:hypothetical protein
MITSNTPWSSTTTASSIIFSCIIFSMSFYRLAPTHYPSVKQSAWILTAISSAVMSLASLPFLYDYLSNGGDVKSIRDIPNLSLAACRFFQSHLAKGHFYF